MRPLPAIRPDERVALTQDAPLSSTSSSSSLRKAQSFLGIRDQPVRNRLTKLPKGASHNDRLLAPSALAFVPDLTRSTTGASSQASLYSPVRDETDCDDPPRDHDHHNSTLPPKRLHGIDCSDAGPAHDLNVSPARQDSWSRSQYINNNAIDGLAQPLTVPHDVFVNPSSAAPSIHGDSGFIQTPLSDADIQAMSSANAWRRSKSAMETTTVSVQGQDTKSSKRLVLSSLLPKPYKSRSRAAIEMTDALDDFPVHTTRAELKRRTGTGRLEVIATNGSSLARESTEPATKTRVKFFEPDIYDTNKVTVRRPPKGIQNWFDGFDISSDEDVDSSDKDAPQLAQDASATPSSAEPLVDKPVAVAVASVHKQDVGRVPVSAKPREVASDRTGTRLGERKAYAPESILQTGLTSLAEEAPNVAQTTANDESNPVLGTGNQYESIKVLRAQRSLEEVNGELASCSMLSLSESDDERAQGRQAVENKSRGHLRRDQAAGTAELPPDGPRIPPRKTHNPASAHVQTLRERGLRGRESRREPFRGTQAVAERDLQRRSVAEDPLERYTEQAAFRRQRSGSSTYSRRKHDRHRRNGSSGRNQHDDHARSLGATTPSSSVPSEGQAAGRIMAVTEEEMVLLEMMRQKKASMQESSLSEAYGNGLRDALMQLRMGRDSTQPLAQEVVKQQGSATGNGGRGHHKRPSVASSSVSGHTTLQDGERVRRTLLADDVRLTYEQRRELNAIRKEELETALRIERFLRQQSPQDDRFPTSLPETRPATYASSVDQSSIAGSQFEETFTYGNRRMSALQRLARSVSDTIPTRYSYATTFEEEEDHRESLRLFLEAQSATVARRELPPRELRREQSKNNRSGSRPAVDSDADDSDSLEETRRVMRDYQSEYGSIPPRTQYSRGASKHVPRPSVLDTPVLEEEPIPQIPKQPFDDKEIVSESIANAVQQAAARLNGIPSITSSPPRNPATQTLNNSLFTPVEWDTASNSHARHISEQVPVAAEHSSEGPVTSAAAASTLLMFPQPPPPLTPPSPPISEAAPDPQLPRKIVPIAKPKPLDLVNNGGPIPPAPQSGQSYSSRANTPTSARLTRQFPKSPSLNTEYSRDSRKAASLISITSASEDVLAAWAELGGGGDAYTARLQRMRKDRNSHR